MTNVQLQRKLLNTLQQLLTMPHFALSMPLRLHSWPPVLQVRPHLHSPNCHPTARLTRSRTR